LKRSAEYLEVIAPCARAECSGSEIYVDRRINHGLEGTVMERGKTISRSKTLPLRIVLLVLSGIGSTLAAQDAGSSSWANVLGLTPGRSIEVIDRQGAAIKGELALVSADSVTVKVKHRAVAVPRSEVWLVRVRSGKRRRYALIGAAIGAGAGLGLGVAGGESLSNGGGGDLANFKPVIIAGSAAAGALIGTVIGSLFGHRATTVYDAK
jgi:hypothetical protein